MWEILPQILKKMYKKTTDLKVEWGESGISSHFLRIKFIFFLKNKVIS